MRSLLFVPADSERKIARGLASGADVVILDLEDSVAAASKPAARRLAAEVLGSERGSSPMLIVRVNALESGLVEADLEAVMSAGPDGFMQPKTRHAEDVKALAAMAGSGGLPIVAIATETAGALFGLQTYVDAVPPLVGLTWGAEDLSNDLGAEASRDDAGRLTDPYRLARTLCLIGARAAGIEPIDTIYANYRDTPGLEAECRAAARDGFTGKMAIHPDQVAPINRAFTPAPDAVARARRIVEAFQAAGDAGVVGLDRGVEPRHHAAVGVEDELLEVPGDVAGAALLVGGLRELVVQRVPALAVHLDLLGHRERDAVGGRAELRDLVGAARLLATELVARKADDREAPRCQLLVQGLEDFVAVDERQIDVEQHIQPLARVQDPPLPPLGLIQQPLLQHLVHALVYAIVKFLPITVQPDLDDVKRTLLSTSFPES